MGQWVGFGIGLGFGLAAIVLIICLAAGFAKLTWDTFWGKG
jgi:hypothetical protein